MQEKKKLDDMAEKYKEEMMRIYNKKRAEQSAQQKEPEPKPDSVSETVPDKKTEQAAKPKKNSYDKKERGKKHKKGSSGGVNSKPESNSHGDEQCQHNNARDNEKLMHPPMPEIPHDRGKPHSRKPSEEPKEQPSEPCEKAEKDCASERSQSPKFPTAKELISMDGSGDSDGKDAEKAVPASAMQENDSSRLPDPRFESEGNVPDNIENNDGHMQGNYNFRSEPDGDNTDEPEHSDPEMSAGHGYLQAEVTEQGSGSPISGAAVVVVRRIGDYDSLEAILTTDSHGMTESLELAVPCVSSVQNGDPCEEYMVTVYKEGFYSVNMLPVPVFDTIKSIQPVEMARAEK